MTPTVGSCFAGLAGLDLGLELAGFKILWQSEIVPYFNALLHKHHPDAEQVGDMREAMQFEPVDVIVGGFPCQDISTAGKRVGITGSRSGLWREMVRAIRMVRPLVVIVENVAAILDRGLGRVLGDLAASGYDAEWDCLPACAFGATHRRDRAFVVAYPQREGLERQEFAVFPPSHTWQPVSLFGLSESDVLRTHHGLPNYVEQIVGLGNAVYVPQAQQIGSWVKEAMGW